MTYVSSFQAFKLQPMALSCLFRIASPRREFCPFGNLPCVSEGQRFITCNSDLCHDTLHVHRRSTAVGHEQTSSWCCRCPGKGGMLLAAAGGTAAAVYPACGCCGPPPPRAVLHRCTSEPESLPFPKITTAETPFRTAPATPRDSNPRGTAGH